MHYGNAKNFMEAATFGLRIRTQAEASKRRLKPATTNTYKKRKVFLTIPTLYSGGKKMENSLVLLGLTKN